MQSLIRPSLLASAVLLVLAGASQHFGFAKADDQPAVAAVGTKVTAPPPGSGARNLILGSKDGRQPENMDQFLTAVTKDVDSYWTKVFKDSGLPAPRTASTGTVLVNAQRIAMCSAGMA